MSIGFLSGGTSGTTGPFRSGASGHYITLCIPVDEFYESGTVYLFDSLPRSMDNEDYETDERFFAAYAFNGNTSRARELKSQWSINRISDTVLKLSPIGGKPAEWQEQEYQLSLLEVYDTGIAFLACKPKTN